MNAGPHRGGSRRRGVAVFALAALALLASSAHGELHSLDDPLARALQG
jgi:hypothetical protein